MSRLRATVCQAMNRDDAPYPKENPLPEWLRKLLGKKKEGDEVAKKPETLSDEDIADLAEGRGKKKYKIRSY